MSLTKRLLVPVAVVALVAGGLSLGPSLMARARPGLPPIGAEKLLTNMQRSDVDGVSGIVRVHSDLGLPRLPARSEGSDNHYSTSPRELLTGDHTLQVAAAGPHRQRVAILDELSQYTVVHNGRDVWTYESAENTAVHYRLPQRAGQEGGDTSKRGGHPPITPRELAQRFLGKIGPATSVSVSGTEQVAGRAVYTLRLDPRSAETLIGSVRIFVDGETWTPLRVTVTPRGGGSPAVDAGYSEVSFGEPPASRFTFTPPPGTEVKEKTVPPRDGGAGGAGQGGGAGHGRGDDAGAAGDARGEGSRTAAGDARRSQDGTGQPGRPHRAGSSTSPAVVGHGWESVLSYDEIPSGRYGGWLKRTGKPVSGEFGEGHVITTRLVSALVTEDGHLYVGAVSPEVLRRAAAGAS